MKVFYMFTQFIQYLSIAGILLCAILGNWLVAAHCIDFGTSLYGDSSMEFVWDDNSLCSVQIRSRKLNYV